MHYHVLALPPSSQPLDNIVYISVAIRQYASEKDHTHCLSPERLLRKQHLYLLPQSQSVLQISLIGALPRHTNQLSTILQD